MFEYHEIQIMKIILQTIVLNQDTDKMSQNKILRICIFLITKDKIVSTLNADFYHLIMI